MEIYLEKENKTINYEINEKITIKELLKLLNITLESVIILKNGEVTIEEEVVENKDLIKILSVISGG